MAANPIWIAAYGGPPPAAIGAAPVWVAPGDGSVPSAAASVVVGYGGPVAGASPVWIAGYGGPVAGATPITLVGFGGSGGSGGGTTSVWSAADASANGMTLTNGGATVSSTISGWNTVRGTIGKATGKLYFETVTSTAVTAPHYAGIGIATGDTASSGISGNYLGSFANSGGAYLFGSQFNAGPLTWAYGFAAADAAIGDVLGFAVDLDAGKGWISYNGAWVGGGNPATGASPACTFTLLEKTTTPIFPGISLQSGATGTWTLHGAAASQKYAPPSGFTAWDGGVAPPPTSVWSAADATANAMTLSNGGLTVVPSGSALWQSVRGSIGKTAGKLYVEFSTSVAVSGSGIIEVGLASSGFVATNYLGSSNYSFGDQFTQTNLTYESTGFSQTANHSGIPLAANGVIGLAIDFTAQYIWLAYNNTWVGSGNPAGGATPYETFVAATVGALFPAMSFMNANAGVWTLQATAATQKYAPPAGFTPWG